MGRAEIGIDVGWSTRRRSCAVALRNCDLPLPMAKTYGASRSGVRAARLYLTEVCNLVSKWHADFPDVVNNAVVTIDGPMGPSGRPTRNRDVDSRFASGDFHGRTQPYYVEHKSSALYLDATYAIVDSFAHAGSFSVQVAGQRAANGLTLAETHPTVALAVLAQRAPKDQVPSRKNPVLIEKRSVGAKSDFYWIIGGRSRVQSALGSPVGKERDHELVAGLVCLMISAQLAGTASDGSHAEPHGNPAQGVYFLPDPWHQDWLDRSETRLDGVQSKVVAVRKTRQSMSADQENLDSNDLDAGDRVILTLCDNGGIWEKHNSWLSGIEGDCFYFRLIDSDTLIELNRAGGSGQWTSRPTPLDLARQFGFQRDHLERAYEVLLEGTIEGLCDGGRGTQLASTAPSRVDSNTIPEHTLNFLRKDWEEQRDSLDIQEDSPTEADLELEFYPLGRAIAKLEAGERLTEQERRVASDLLRSEFDDDDIDQWLGI